MTGTFSFTGMRRSRAMRPNTASPLAAGSARVPNRLRGLAPLAPAGA